MILVCILILLMYTLLTDTPTGILGGEPGRIITIKSPNSIFNTMSIRRYLERLWGRIIRQYSLNEWIKHNHKLIDSSYEKAVCRMTDYYQHYVQLSWYTLGVVHSPYYIHPKKSSYTGDIIKFKGGDVMYHTLNVNKDFTQLVIEQIYLSRKILFPTHINFIPLIINMWPEEFRSLDTSIDIVFSLITTYANMRKNMQGIAPNTKSHYSKINLYNSNKKDMKFIIYENKLQFKFHEINMIVFRNDFVNKLISRIHLEDSTICKAECLQDYKTFMVFSFLAHPPYFKYIESSYPEIYYKLLYSVLEIRLTAYSDYTATRLFYIPNTVMALVSTDSFLPGFQYQVTLDKIDTITTNWLFEPQLHDNIFLSYIYIFLSKKLPILDNPKLIVLIVPTQYLYEKIDDIVLDIKLLESFEIKNKRIHIPQSHNFRETTTTPKVELIKADYDSTIMFFYTGNKNDIVPKIDEFAKQFKLIQNQLYNGRRQISES